MDRQHEQQPKTQCEDCGRESNTTRCDRCEAAHRNQLQKPLKKTSKK